MGGHGIRKVEEVGSAGNRGGPRGGDTLAWYETGVISATGLTLTRCALLTALWLKAAVGRYASGGGA